jgi:hypothetical protein
MKLLQLNKGLYAKVDDEDYEELLKYNWRAKKDGNVYYVSTGGYYKGKNNVKILHRYIMNAPKGCMVDHVDGDGLNCQRHNMRLCNNQQNQFNQRIKTTNNKSSIYKGVVSLRTCNSHQAFIRINKVKVYLGSFKTPEAAAVCYNNAAIEHFGEFARINNI